MTQPSKTRRAIVVQGPGTATVVTVTTPNLSPTNVLVKTACVGLNPSDAKMVQAGMPQGSMAGLDFAGIVISKGTNVSSDIHPGDRVCGVAFGYNNNDEATGAFAEYVVAEEHLLFRIPDSISFQEAATFPCGLLTGGMVLHNTMKLKTAPADGDRHVLIYGGSTASGLFMIQLLKQCGFIPIVTCSPHNFPLVKSAGAAGAFDYTSPTCAADIRALTADRLAHAADCITTPDSMRICYDALGAAGGRYVALDSFPIASHSRRAVRPSWIFAMSAFGSAVDWVAPYKCGASTADREFAAAWTREVAALVGAGDVRPLRYRVVGETLDDVGQGLEELRSGRVSGTKLVCIVDKSMV
ncbi:Trans-enoyl reductase lepG [Colletotrichum sp. SAR 10_99]|nr:Trans-enoyl reductase lepG [Colletotrichum sp. SAR 10_99]